MTLVLKINIKKLIEFDSFIDLLNKIYNLDK